MRVAISYPPLESPKGVPLLGQNRQFQWFTNPTYIYPMVPACGATLLKDDGFEVLWDDGIAEGLGYEAWLSRIAAARPDLIAIETKTPVVKRHWKIIDGLKEKLPGAKVALMGDHVTALPEESLLNSMADYVLTGGDYDFLLLSLARSLREGKGASGLDPGIWFRDGGTARNSGSTFKKRDLDSLPFIDRDLTKWRLYSEKNGNFKRKPGTYTMAGRDCWWGRCSFCSWTTLYPGRDFRSVSPARLLDEIGILIERYGVREVFDDSGSFPASRWLEEFCRGMIERGYYRKIKMGCNMRINALSEEEYEFMARAGFRFVLFGLESVNQSTLDRLRKGLRVEEIIQGFRNAKKAGLEPHVTVMAGYPWEKREDAAETIEFAREMFRAGYVDTLQATIVVPYPGTPMYDEAKRNGWLLTEDWDRYDMRESVWKSPLDSEDIKGFTRDLYKAALSPRFIMRKLLDVRGVDDLRFLFTAGSKLLGHLTDFGGRERKASPHL